MLGRRFIDEVLDLIVWPFAFGPPREADNYWLRFDIRRIEGLVKFILAGGVPAFERRRFALLQDAEGSPVLKMWQETAD
jgi:hypothetical protein